MQIYSVYNEIKYRNAAFEKLGPETNVYFCVKNESNYQIIPDSNYRAGKSEIIERRTHCWFWPFMGFLVMYPLNDVNLTH